MEDNTKSSSPIRSSTWEQSLSRIHDLMSYSSIFWSSKTSLSAPELPEISMISDEIMCKNLLNVIIQTAVSQIIHKFVLISELLKIRQNTRIFNEVSGK